MLLSVWASLPQPPQEVAEEVMDVHVLLKHLSQEGEDLLLVVSPAAFKHGPHIIFPLSVATCAIYVGDWGGKEGM